MMGVKFFPLAYPGKDKAGVLAILMKTYSATIAADPNL